MRYLPRLIIDHILLSMPSPSSFLFEQNATLFNISFMVLYVRYFQTCKVFVIGLVYLKMKIVSLLTHPHVSPNSHDLQGTKEKAFKPFGGSRIALCCKEQFGHASNKRI